MLKLVLLDLRLNLNNKFIKEYISLNIFIDISKHTNQETKNWFVSLGKLLFTLAISSFIFKMKGLDERILHF